jgi:hypothetical protein
MTTTDYIPGRQIRTPVRSAEHVSFGIRDDRGRELGIETRVYSVNHTPIEGTYNLIRADLAGRITFLGSTSTTRDGRTYGAITSPVMGATIEEVEKKLAKRVADARKRYEKKFGD